MTQIHYHETGSTYAPYNLAMEQALVEAMADSAAPDDPGCFLLWQNSPAVIIGRHQNAQGEVHLAELERRGIALVRRLTGGGAVYHDLGNLNFSFILPRRKGMEPQAAELLQPLIAYLGSLGVTAEMQGRNDLTIPGRGKFSGLAGRQLPGVYQLHGTLLFDVDLSVLEQVLNVDPEKYRSKGVQSVKARVTNLRPLLPIDLPTFWAGIQDAYAPLALPLPPAVAQRAEQLAREKYATRHWNIGESPPSDLVLKKRFAFGSLQLHLATKKNIISAAHIAGDFLTPSTGGLEQIPVEQLAEALLGLPADAPALWAEAWKDVDMSRVFYGTADSEEIRAWLASCAA